MKTTNKTAPKAKQTDDNDLRARLSRFAARLDDARCEISQSRDDIEQLAFYGQDVSAPCDDIDVVIEHLVNMTGELLEWAAEVRPPRMMPWEARAEEVAS